MMNKRTRKISKFIEETREETKGIFMEITHPIIDNEYGRKLRELDVDTADIVQTGLLVCIFSFEYISRPHRLLFKESSIHALLIVEKCSQNGAIWISINM